MCVCVPKDLANHWTDMVFLYGSPPLENNDHPKIIFKKLFPLKTAIKRGGVVDLLNKQPNVSFLPGVLT